MRIDRYDAVVLGAGMAGVCFAIAMAEAGKKVLVADRAGVKGQSSPAAGGILDPLLEMKPDSPLFRLSQKAFQGYPGFIKKIQSAVKADVGYKKTGMLYVALDADQLDVLKKRYLWQKKSAIPVTWMSREKIFKQYPYLSAKSMEGMFYPTIGRVHPDKLLNALKIYARKRGVRFQSIKADARIIARKNRVTGVRLENKFVLSPVVLNAAGAWAAKFNHPALRPRVSPVRGQIIIYAARNWSCEAILHTVDGGYLVPWEKNRYLAGSTVEHVGFNSAVTGKGKSLIRKKVSSLIPAVENFKPVKTWAGLRPFSQDGLPWIGETKLRGYYLAAGYYRSGILISPLAGRLLAQQVLSGKSPAELKPFSPTRRFKKVPR